MTTPTHQGGVEEVCWLGEVRALVDGVDQAVYDAVAGTDTPRLDRLLVDVSNAANYSRLWLATAAALAVVGGDRGRRAARQGVPAIALTSAVTNLILKPLAGRQRPGRSAVPARRPPAPAPRAGTGPPCHRRSADSSPRPGDRPTSGQRCSTRPSLPRRSLVVSPRTALPPSSPTKAPVTTSDG